MRTRLGPSAAPRIAPPVPCRARCTPRTTGGRPAVDASEAERSAPRMVGYFLLLVRSIDDVPGACREAAQVLAFRRRRLPPLHEERVRTPIGVWVDTALVDSVPEILGGAAPGHAPQFRIRQSAGLSSVWSLSWLDLETADDAVDLGSIRRSLIEALMAGQAFTSRRTVSQFVPVFDVDTHPVDVRLETARLRRRFPGAIGGSIVWNHTAGTFTKVPGTKASDLN